MKKTALNQKHLTKIEERAKYNSISSALTKKFFSFAVFYANQAQNSEDNNVGDKPAGHLFADLHFVQVCYILFI